MCKEEKRVTNELDSFLDIQMKIKRVKKSLNEEAFFVDESLTIYISVYFFFELLQEPYSFLVALACSIE